MALTLRTARCVTALVALTALAAFDAARANHFILPCGDVCTDPHWALTGSLNTARLSHSATLLPNGKVLVVGGVSIPVGPVLGSAELYDPATGMWGFTGQLHVDRADFTATLLPSGKVLVAGGVSTLPSTAELYDPATGLWEETGAMHALRWGGSATLLQNGKVLVAGGLVVDSGIVDSAELYDPATGTWSPTGSLNVERNGHTATLLQDGKVLVAGGVRSGLGILVLGSAELYDPASGTWSPTGNMRSLRFAHTATLLPNGKVLVAGGDDGTDEGINDSTAEIFDPATGVWMPTGNLNGARIAHTATLLPDGNVLVAGGLFFHSINSAEVYDAASATWSSTANLNTARDQHTATLLLSGAVLVAGGSVEANGTVTPLNSAELYGAARIFFSRASGGSMGPIPRPLTDIKVRASWSGVNVRGTDARSGGPTGGQGRPNGRPPPDPLLTFWVEESRR